MVFLSMITATIMATATTPFEFGGLNTRDSMSAEGRELRNCVGNLPRRLCQLTRTSFADIPIAESVVVIQDGIMQSMFIRGEAKYYGEAVEALVLRYGAPVSYDSLRDLPGARVSRKSSLWAFRDGFLQIHIKGDDPQFLISFIKNRKSTPNLDF